MKYIHHRVKWDKCTLCDLCERRRRVVLLRGNYPAPILFIGEAPGASEDVLGRPFIGNAGKLLDKIMKAAGLVKGDYALTNLIACIPKDETGKKVTTPPSSAIKACKERLNECVGLVKPRAIVWVGSEAKKWGPKVLDPPFPPERTVAITHPAAILRANVAQKGLAVQRCIVTLQDLAEEIL